MHSESLALQALLARLAATHRLSPHSAVSSRCLLLLSRVGGRALGTHRPGTSDATACAADIDHTGGSQLGSYLWSELLMSSQLCSHVSELDLGITYTSAVRLQRVSHFLDGL